MLWEVQHGVSSPFVPNHGAEGTEFFSIGDKWETKQPDKSLLGQRLGALGKDTGKKKKS